MKNSINTEAFCQVVKDEEEFLVLPCLYFLKH